MYWPDSLLTTESNLEHWVCSNSEQVFKIEKRGSIYLCRKADLNKLKLKWIASQCNNIYEVIGFFGHSHLAIVMYKLCGIEYSKAVTS